MIPVTQTLTMSVADWGYAVDQEVEVDSQDTEQEDSAQLQLLS